MIQFTELCGSLDPHTLSLDIYLNLSQLHYRLNVLRRYWDKPMTVTSGFRTIEEHMKIYEKKNSERVASGLSKLSIPMGSMHLIGAAADVYDLDGTLKEWVLKNRTLVETLRFHCEDFASTKNWVHFQIYPPRSREFIFKP